MTLIVGPVAESVTVEAATPLVDTTSKTVGGHVGTEELLGLPSANRSFVGFIALLPGIVPIGADALGADAVSVNGIDPRSNNFLLDGANNNDDYLGQRAGTQARTPIEAIQEFQVLTHQFDAEFGRATGAVINAVTRQGSNVFRGSAFSFFQHSRLTSRDFFTRQNGLSEPDIEQQHYGGTVGGPVVRNQAHFFFSLEAIRADRAATVNIPSRPDLNASTTTRGRAWNTIVRFDHQPAAAHTWGIRWLRESSPQENVLIPAGGRQVTLNAAREEDDVDQTTVGTLQSVFGNSRVNTVRVGFTRENVAFANPGFNSNGRRQDLLLPTLQYQTFIDQQNDVATARINSAWSIEDTVSWFVPARGGSHDLKFGLQYQYATVDNTNQGMLNGLFEFRSNTAFDCRRSRDLPGAPADQGAGSEQPLDERPLCLRLFPGPVAARRPADAEPWPSLRPRIDPAPRRGQSGVPQSGPLSARHQQRRATAWLHLQPRRGEAGSRARRLRDLLRQDGVRADRAGRHWPAGSRRRSSPGSLPTVWIRGPRRAGCRSSRCCGTGRPSIPTLSAGSFHPARASATWERSFSTALTGACRGQTRSASGTRARSERAWRRTSTSSMPAAGIS